jgi:hypothetical protein
MLGIESLKPFLGPRRSLGTNAGFAVLVGGVAGALVFISFAIYNKNTFLAGMRFAIDITEGEE